MLLVGIAFKLAGGSSVAPFHQREVDEVGQPYHDDDDLLRAPQQPSGGQADGFAYAVQRQRLPYQHRIGSQPSLRDGHAYRAEEVEHEGGSEAQPHRFGEGLEDEEAAQDVEEVDDAAVEYEQQQRAGGKVEDAFQPADTPLEDVVYFAEEAVADAKEAAEEAVAEVKEEASTIIEEEA